MSQAWVYRVVWKRSRLIPLAGLVLLLGAAFRQGALSLFGLTEAIARELVLEEVRNGGTDTRVMSARWHGRMVLRGRSAYQKIPVGQRAQATAGIFAWAKVFIASPAFKAAYTQIRADLKPIPREYALTIDQEVKKEVDEQIAGHEQTKQATASMPAKDRETILASIKQAQAQLRSPDFLQAVRAGKVEERAQEQASMDNVTREWQETFPVDSRAFAAKALRALLEGTAGVDYSAKLVTVVGESGEGLWFANTSYRETKPWMWVEAILAGKEAVTAARVAAEAWLKEIGG
jgi:hypothetical protein